MLTRYRRQNVEGARLLVGERWDACSQLWLPCYPDLIAHPRHTPAGRRVLLCIEDAAPKPAQRGTTAPAWTAASAATTASCPAPCSAPAATHPKAPRQHLWRSSGACRGTPASRGKTRPLDQRQRQRRKHHETLTP